MSESGCPSGEKKERGREEMGFGMKMKFGD
jgi:hypothetical protein